MTEDIPRKYFEDFVVGEEALSPGRTVTEADIVNFAALSGDYSQLHTDAEFTKSTLFGQRIAHGLLGLSVASGLLHRAGGPPVASIAFLGLTWNFKGPIFIGDTVKVRTKLLEKRLTRHPDRGIIVYQRQVINQRGEVVQEGQTTHMVRRRQP